MTNILKKATFGLWIFLLIMMIAATIIEKLYGTTVSSTYFYGSPFFIGLWIATTLLSLLYIIKRHIIRNKKIVSYKKVLSKKPEVPCN
jgi:Mn2+/Fe2+ NRAMP family transporter